VEAEPYETVFQPTAAGKPGLASLGLPRTRGRYAVVPTKPQRSPLGFIFENAPHPVDAARARPLRGNHEPSWHYTPKRGSWLDMANPNLAFWITASPKSKSSPAKSPHGRSTATRRPASQLAIHNGKRPRQAEKNAAFRPAITIWLPSSARGPIVI
jgi:hypothetical protein